MESSLLRDSHAIASKNMMLELVNTIRDSVTFSGALDMTEVVFSTLVYTKGVWIAAKYGYKAREIAELAIDALDDRIKAYGKKNRRAEELRAGLVGLSIEIYKAHMETFHGGA
jgi:hypothetical protein